MCFMDIYASNRYDIVNYTYIGYIYIYIRVSTYGNSCTIAVVAHDVRSISDPLHILSTFGRTNQALKTTKLLHESYNNRESNKP